MSGNTERNVNNKNILKELPTNLDLDMKSRKFLTLKANYSYPDNICHQMQEKRHNLKG